MTNKHFVKMFFPSHLPLDIVSREISDRTIEEALKICKEVSQEVGVKPYCFQLQTGDSEPRSPKYYLSGVRRMREDVLGKNDPDEKLLRQNLRSHPDILAVVEVFDPWRMTLPLGPNDLILD